MKLFSRSLVQINKWPFANLIKPLFNTLSGHGLKPLDIEFMKQLHDKVNIIPVLAKADTMTPEEITAFKQTIMNQIAGAKIKIYEFPDVSDGEENDKKENRRMKERVPFAVVGSNMIIDVDGKKARGRKYPWGAVNIENLEHCDFVPLRNMLIRTHLMDLKDVTNFIHYENYRCRKLAGITGTEKVNMCTSHISWYNFIKILNLNLHVILAPAVMSLI